MNQRRIPNAAALVGGFAFFCISSASADEVLSFHLVTHASSVQSLEVGDAEGHVLELARQSGLALFPDGSVGTSYYAATNDVEIANGVEAVQDGRIFIERVNEPFLAAGGSGEQFKAGIERAIVLGWL